MSAGEFDLATVASPYPVPPGAETTITLSMTAPYQFGRAYRSRWQLRDADGAAFGHFFVEITVVPAPTAGDRRARLGHDLRPRSDRARRDAVRRRD